MVPEFLRLNATVFVGLRGVVAHLHVIEFKSVCSGES